MNDWKVVIRKQFSRHLSRRPGRRKPGGTISEGQFSIRKRRRDSKGTTLEVVNVFERKFKVSIRRAKQFLDTVDGNALIVQGSTSGELR